METLTNISLVLGALGASGMVVRWLYVQVRNSQVNAKFVEDMACNHLPHLYHADRKICEKLGIELEDPPPIRFIKFNGNGKH